MNKRMWAPAVWALAVALSIHAEDAVAQNAPDAKGTEAQNWANDEIIVTARKRAESLQDVPLSITAVSGDTLVSQGITDVRSLASITSGVTVHRSAQNAIAFRVRGLGTVPTNDTYEQSVSVFMDGVYFGRAPQYIQPIFDIDRVEILKGSQASLLAKNTSLGAVIMTSRRPGSDFGVNGMASYDLENGSRVFEVGFDAPLSDTFAIRFSGQSNLEPGYGRNLALDTRVQRNNALAGRMVAVWEPSDDLAATLIYHEFKVTNTGSMQELVEDIYGYAAQRAALAGVPYERELDYRTAVSGNPYGDNQESLAGRRASLQLSRDFGGYDLTSMSAYTKFVQRRKFDADEYVGRYIEQNPFDSGAEQYTQEIRFSSPADKKFNFVTGLFYLHEDYFLTKFTDVNADGIVGNSQISGALFADATQKTDNYSAFGQVNIGITDRLTANVGARYTHERRTAIVQRDLVRAGVYTILFEPYPRQTLKRTEDILDGSFGLQYRLTDDAMLYASAARGTKSGGYLGDPSNVANMEYERERSDTVEVGGKFSFGRSRFNIAAFHAIVSDFQQTLFNGRIIQNAPVDIKSTGVEIEAVYQATSDLRLSGSVTYADTKITSGPDKGARPINAPEWTGNIDISYNTQIASGLEMRSNVGAEFASERVWGARPQNKCTGTDPTIALLHCTGAYAKINGRIGIGAEDDSWEVALVGRNLLDKTTVNFARNASFLTGATFAGAAPPRTILLQLTFRR